MPLPPDTVPAIERWQVPLTFAKDALELTWKLAVPLSILPTAIFLWTYLKSMNWTSLFLDSALSGSGLLFLVVAALVFYGVLVWVFVAPSILLIGSAGNMPDCPPSIQVMYLHLVALAAWVVAAIGMLLNWTPWLVLTIPITSAACYAGWKRAEIAPNQSTRMAAFGCAAGYVTTATLSAVCTIYPLSITFALASASADPQGGWFWGAAAGCIAVSCIGTIPGYVYLIRYVDSQDKQKARMAGLISFGVVAIVLFAVMVAVPPIRAVVLRATHVYSTTEVTYQVLKDDLLPAFRASSLKVEKDEDLSTVTAFVAFRFGPVILLCKDDLSQPIDPAADQQTKAKRGINCVPTRDGDLRELRLPP